MLWNGKIPFIKDGRRILIDIEDMNDWIEKNKAHYKEIKNITESDPAEIIGENVALYSIDSKKNIISTLTRRLAASTDFGYIIVVNKGFFDDKVQVYVRCSTKGEKAGVGIFKDIAKKFDAQVGGKEDVAGIIMGKKYINSYLESIRETF